MGWSGSLTASSAVGSSITFTPNAESEDPAEELVAVYSYAGTYTVSSFTAPVKGIYQFELKGAGGATRASAAGNLQYGGSAGGKGGKTIGYLLMEANETVYIGAGGCCRASFVSKVNGSDLASITKSNLYFVAGAGGNGGGYTDGQNKTGYNCKTAKGGNGGGSSGTKTSSPNTGYCDSGNAGTQSAGGAAIAAGSSTDTRLTFAGSTKGSYGKGGNGGYAQGGDHKGMGGRGGDGYYGGSGGSASSCNTTSGDDAGDGASAGGGGGGSGYVKTASFDYNGVTYSSTTTAGGGMAANQSGSVKVTYYARGDLPVVYNGTTLTKIIFNDTEITSLIYNGTTLF